MNIVIGVVFLLFGGFHLLIKIGIWISYGQGMGGGAPALDGVLFPPIFFTIAFVSFNKSLDLILPSIWSFTGIWIGLTALAYITMECCERFGKNKEI